MTNETLYDKLNDIKLKLKDNKKEDALNSVDSLLQELKNELLASDNPYSSKKRLQACSNYAKKAGKMRPIFNYSYNINNKQVYTDGYFIVSLNKDDETTIPDITTSEITPLKLDQILAYFKNSYSYSYYLNVNDFLNFCKINKDSSIYEIKVNDDETIYFNISILKAFIEFMNFKSSDIVKMQYNSLIGFQYCIKDNRSEGGILPLRK